MMTFFTKTGMTIVVSAAALSLAALGAPTAAALVPAGGSAADAVDKLRDQGYHVQLNGKPNGPLSQCVTTGIHGTGGPGTAYVELNCNNTT